CRIARGSSPMRRRAGALQDSARGRACLCISWLSYKLRAGRRVVFLAYGLAPRGRRRGSAGGFGGVLNARPRKGPAIKSLVLGATQARVAEGAPLAGRAIREPCHPAGRGRLGSGSKNLLEFLESKAKCDHFDDT